MMSKGISNVFNHMFTQILKEHLQFTSAGQLRQRNITLLSQEIHCKCDLASKITETDARAITYSVKSRACSGSQVFSSVTGPSVRGYKINRSKF